MNWTSIFEPFGQTPAFAMWLTLAAAGFFALVLFVTLMRAERSVANGALTVITLLAVGVAALATLRASNSETDSREVRNSPAAGSASLAAVACVDDLAGDTVGAACEKVLFGSPDAVAVAVSYGASQLNRLTLHGDVAAANRAMTPELQTLRRAIERDRYGLVAYVLTTRDHCTASSCAAFQSLTDRSQVAANMGEKVYEGLVSRYAASWGAPPPAPLPATAGLLNGTNMPTGKPTNAEFPTSASIPPVSIMTPEPAAAPKAAAAPPSAKQAVAPPAAKKQATPKQRTPAPVQIAPSSTSSTAPTAADD